MRFRDLEIGDIFAFAYDILGEELDITNLRTSNVLIKVSNNHLSSLLDIINNNIRLSIPCVDTAKVISLSYSKYYLIHLNDYI